MSAKLPGRPCYGNQALDARGVGSIPDVPESTLCYWRHAGKGPASYVLGRKVFYDVGDLDHGMAAQKAATLRGGTS